MYRIFLLTTLFLISNLCTMGQESEGSALFDKLLYKSGDDTLPYRLLKPVSPGSMKSYPLIIFLHGSGERGDDNEAQIKYITDMVLDERTRGKYPCYVIAPQCPKGKLWANYDNAKEDPMLNKESTRPMQMVVELIDKIVKEFPIDQSKIYITGISMGGYGTWDLIARYPHKFAAAVPICGGGSPKVVSKIRNIPIWAFHGAKDDVVSPNASRIMIKALQDAGASPGYTEYPDVTHNSWSYAYKEPHLVHWLFKQKLPENAAK